VPAYLEVQGFPEDKPAGRPCAQLDSAGRCAIHAERAAHGFIACAQFDCHGAGQWVTQRLFGGASWRDSPELLQDMAEAYRHWLPRFHAAALLEAALPRVRDEARALLASRIQRLLDVQAADGEFTRDPVALRRETITWIRPLLRESSGCY
jgi:hypothetical protein